MKRALIWLLSATFVLFCVLGIWLSFVGEPYRSDNFDESAYTLSSGWLLEDNKGARTVNAPCKLQGSDAYTLVGTLPEVTTIGSPILMLVSNHMHISAYLDGEMVLDAPTQPLTLSKSPGHRYHFIRLSPGWAGKTLRVVYDNPLSERQEFVFMAPCIGSKATLVYELFVGELRNLAFGIVLLVMGFVMALLCLFFRRSDTFQTAMFCGGLFSMLFALHTLLNTEFICAVFPNVLGVYYGAYISLALLPAPMLYLFRECVDRRFERFFDVAIVTVIVCAAVQTTLTLARVADFRETLTVTHVLIVAGILLSLSTTLLTHGEMRPVALRVALSAAPMLVGAGVDLARFYLFQVSGSTAFFMVGVLLFVLISGVRFLRGYIEDSNVRARADMYRQLAYVDALTRLGNRNAYEERLAQIDANLLNYEHIWCLSADIDNLKKTNDRLGHAAGDKLIADTAKILFSALTENSRDYRTGGDEFVCFLLDVPEETIMECLMALSEGLETYNKKAEEPIYLSYAADCFRPETDDRVGELVIRVDALMYEMKARNRNRMEA